MPDPIDAGLIHALKKMTILFPFFGRKCSKKNFTKREKLRAQRAIHRRPRTSRRRRNVILI